MAQRLAISRTITSRRLFHSLRKTQPSSTALLCNIPSDRTTTIYPSASLLQQKNPRSFHTSSAVLQNDTPPKSSDDDGYVWEEHENPNVKFDGKVFLDQYEKGEEIPIAPLPPHDDGSGKVLASPELHELAEEVVNLSVREVFQLTQLISKEFGLDDEDMMAQMGGGGGGEQQEEEVVVEKTAFDLKLISFDAKAKIKVIKEVRAMTGLGLKESKAMVDGAPKVFMKAVKKEEAEEMKAKLEGLGAVVEME